MEVLWRSSSRSSLSAVLMAASMSCELCSTCANTSGSSGLWLLKLLERPAGVDLRNCGLSTLLLREECLVTELRMLCALTGLLSVLSFTRAPPTGREAVLTPALEPVLSLSEPRNVLLMLVDSGRFLILLRLAR